MKPPSQVNGRYMSKVYKNWFNEKQIRIKMK